MPVRRCELVLDVRERAALLDDVLRQPHDPSLRRQRVEDRPACAPACERLEVTASAGVEPADRVEQTQGAFLPEVVGREPETAVATRDAADEREVGLDQATASLGVPAPRCPEELTLAALRGARTHHVSVYRTRRGHGHPDFEADLHQ